MLVKNKIFDTSKIRENDPYREDKIKILKGIETNYKNLMKPDEKKTEWFILFKDEVVEKALSDIIKKYKESGGLDEEKIGGNPGNFENDWVERIRDIKTTKKQALKIASEVKGLFHMYNHLGECLEYLYTKFGYANSSPLIRDTYTVWNKSDEWVKILEDKLNRFDKMVVRECNSDPIFLNETKAERELAISMFRNEILVDIDKSKTVKVEVGSEAWNKEQVRKQNSAAKSILHTLDKCVFYKLENGNIMVKERENHYHGKGDTYFEKIQKREIEELNDDLLEVGKKKTDLLKRLAEVMEEGRRKVNGVSQTDSTITNANTNDDSDSVSLSSSGSETSDSEISNDTPASSIFGGDEEETNPGLTDNSSVSSENKENEKETPDSNEIWKEVNIKKIKNLLNEEPVVKEADLEPENRNWLAEIQECNDREKIWEITWKTFCDIRNKRETKKQGAELDNIIESAPADNQEKVVKNLRTINKSLGDKENEIKAERAQKKMMESNPELYFDSFIQFVKEEEAELEEERKRLEEENQSETSSVIEYDEEEQQFLNGEITDKKKKKEIVKRIEIKIKLKKQSWSFKKWWKAWWDWAKTKASLLKKKNKVEFENNVKQAEQELKNMENSSNPLTQQVYRENQKLAEALKEELAIISQTDNQTKTTENNKSLLRKEVVIPAVIGGVILLTAVILVITRKSKGLKKKKQR